MSEDMLEFLVRLKHGSITIEQSKFLPTHWSYLKWIVVTSMYNNVSRPLSFWHESKRSALEEALNRQIAIPEHEFQNYLDILHSKEYGH